VITKPLADDRDPCRVIPICVDQNPWAHFLSPRDMIFQG
jgi:hypothetical protein